MADNLPPTVLRDVGTKTIQGASLMVLRTLVLYPVGFIGEVSLSRLLTPQDVGVYAIASFITVTFAGVMEVGLAAALIQRKTEATNEEYQTLFTLQILGISALVLLVFLLAPWLFPLVNFEVGIRWTILALLLCPWISSFGTISAVKLERELRYSVFAKIDVMRGITYVTIAVGLAYWGAKSWSFVIATIASTLVKAGVAFREAPWPVRFRLKLSGMGQTLRFGVMFQLSTLTSLFRDHIGVVLGGPLFGPQSVGYLNWSKNLTYYTSQIFTQVVSRVAFPSISRVQENPEAVGQMTQTMFKYVNLFTFPVIFTFASLIPEFVSVVFTDKWKPAIPAFYFYSLRMIGSNVTTLYINVFYALGRLKTALRIVTYWTLLDWVLALIFCPLIGFSGIALACGVSVLPISVWLILTLNRYARVDLTKSLFLPLLLSGLACLPIVILKSRVVPSWLTVAGLAGSALLIYVALLILVERKTLLSEGKVFWLSLVQR
jgi:O-antigen/teichoic acid export membrane protein